MGQGASSKGEPAQKNVGKPAKPIVTPSDVRKGSVVRVNSPARYVIIAFTPGYVPSKGQTAQVYRQGLKVAELLITGPQQLENTAADIVEGQVFDGDEVRLK